MFLVGTPYEFDMYLDVPNIPEAKKDHRYDDVFNSGENPANKSFKIENINNDPHYYTISIEKTNDGKYMQSFYLDGNFKISGELNSLLMTEMLKRPQYSLCVGAALGCDEKKFDSEVKWCVSLCTMRTKCIRLYNRGLTNTEVKANYDQTTFYHDSVMGKDLK